VKIWNICPTHDPAFGGLYRGINDFAKALDAPILSFDDGRRDRSGLGDRALRIPAGSGLLSRDCHVIARAAAEQAEEAITGADLLVVHSLYRAHTSWAATWARRHGKRYWAVPHGCLDPWSLRQRALAKRFWLAAAGRRYLADAERVVFATRRGLEKAANWVAPSTPAVMHWPVDLPSREANALTRIAVRRRLGIPGDDPILLAVGRLHSVKRPIETVTAFCQAKTGPAHLVMVGMDGDLTAAEVMQAVPAECRPFVHAVGGLVGDELANVYRAADGFISLSFQENFGYAAADAIASGLPAILSPGHDLAYDIPPTAPDRLPCGWLLESDSPGAAVAAISDWSSLAAGSQPGPLAQMGAAGQAWAEESLSRQRFQNELRALL
jgi:glycosyltransferase involved in cell wall biosynthesis